MFEREGKEQQKVTRRRSDVYLFGVLGIAGSHHHRAALLAGTPLSHQTLLGQQVTHLTDTETGIKGIERNIRSPGGCADLFRRSRVAEVTTRASVRVKR